jgi:predicted DCC family thiol-disulfide oxidoreductase YuxK
MSSNLAVKFSPIVSDEKKIDVALQNNQAVIKLSTWTEDLGWICQKTLSLEEEMLDDLHRVIAAARYKIKNRGAEAEHDPKTPKVIEFPTFS